MLSEMTDLDALELDLNRGLGGSERPILPSEIRALIAELRASRKVVEAARALMDDIAAHDRASDVPIEYDNQAWLRDALSSINAKETDE